MEMQKVEFVMSSEQRDQLIMFIVEIPGKYCIPVMQIINSLEQRSTPKPKGSEAC